MGKNWKGSDLFGRGEKKGFASLTGVGEWLRESLGIIYIYRERNRNKRRETEKSKSDAPSKEIRNFLSCRSRSCSTDKHVMSRRILLLNKAIDSFPF